MPTVRANRLEIFYEDSGPASGPVIVLIMGLASQLTAWPPGMISRLNDAGFRTLRFDNRDIGLSQKLDHRRAPNLLLQSALARFRIRTLAPYRLTDMAQDTIGLMDELKIEQAHVVGISMGGMISQILSARYPERVYSLTAIMTSTNRRSLPGPRGDVARLLFRPGPPPKTTDEIVERGMEIWNLIRTRDGGLSDDELRVRVRAAVERSYCPAGQRRQTAAIVETGDLTRWTRRIAAPTLVIHGDADPLVRLAAGQDVAATIKGSRLEVISGMGHDLPPAHLNHITDLIIQHAQASGSPNSGSP